MSLAAIVGIILNLCFPGNENKKQTEEIKRISGKVENEPETIIKNVIETENKPKEKTNEITVESKNKNSKNEETKKTETKIKPTTKKVSTSKTTKKTTTKKTDSKNETKKKTTQRKATTKKKTAEKI